MDFGFGDLKGDLLAGLSRVNDNGSFRLDLCCSRILTSFSNRTICFFKSSSFYFLNKYHQECRAIIECVDNFKLPLDIQCDD